ncbi:MAG: hypothetical protein ACREI8_16185 [Myxococcota bacterium]
MSTAKEPWADEVKEAVAKRAYTLNYEDGVQTRVLPLQSAEGRHVWELKLEMTHSGHEFDLTWFVRWTDAEIDGISFELVAPPTEGATIWSEHFGSLPMFRAASDVLPVFMRGFFVGRESVINRQPAGDPAES